jgi:flagellar FliJ protein
MSKTFSLQPLVDLSHHKNDAATLKLGQLNQKQQAEQKKLETLLQFRRDYQNKFREATQSGMDQNGLRNFQNFLDRLDEAIQQQRSVIEQATQSFANGRDELHQAQRAMKSFDTLAQRHAETVRQQNNQTDQKLQDEQSGRFAARNDESTDKP